MPLYVDALQPQIKTQLLVLQPTPFCNINCSYCYLPNRDHKARMSLSTVTRAAARLREDGLLGKELTVVWHAGEPLVMPVSYYVEAFSAISEELADACTVNHSIQTNGTLINDAWCDLFSEYKVKVGVSVDGPALIHDGHRRLRNGKGSHEAVMRGLETLRRNQIPHHAIAVVTSDSLDSVDTIHAFLEEQQIHEVGFNFDEVEGCNTLSSIGSHEDKHRLFMEAMLAHMLASRGTFQVRELMSAVRLVAHGMPTIGFDGRLRPFNTQVLPFAMISVAWDGNFSTFSPELLGQPSMDYSNFILGNVAQDGYLESVMREPFMNIWNDISRGVDRCESMCPYFGYCGGGSPVNKLYENGDMASTETLYCRSMVQRPLEAVLTSLETVTWQTTFGASL